MFSNKTGGGRRPIPWSILGALLYFAILCVLEFPRPMMDDLFYGGAGLHLAGGGDLANPLLSWQHFPGHYFFVYPPLHSYLLGGWLAIFGVGTRSWLAFQAVSYFVMAMATICLLRYHKAPVSLEWLVLPAISAAFLSAGLRPEAPAVALTMAGFAILEIAGRQNWPIALGSFLLLFLGASAAPRMAPFALALALYCVIRRRDEAAIGARTTTGRLTAAAAALALAGLVFAVMIRFRFSEFHEAFALHATRVESGRFRLLKLFVFTIAGARHLPLLALAALLSCIFLRPAAGGVQRPAIFIAGAFVLAAMIGALGHGSIWFVSLLVLFLGTAAIRQLPGRWPAVTMGSIAAAILFANIDHMIELSGMLAGKVHTETLSPGGRTPNIQPAPGHPLLVDAWAARYAFDYRLPEGCIDFAFAAPFPGTLATDARLDPRDVFLVGPNSVEILDRKTALRQPVPKWAPFGFQRWACDVHPCQVFRVTAVECGAGN